MATRLHRRHLAHLCSQVPPRHPEILAPHPDVCQLQTPLAPLVGEHSVLLLMAQLINATQRAHATVSWRVPADLVA
jgi:hypothetical protein